MSHSFHASPTKHTAASTLERPFRILLVDHDRDAAERMVQRVSIKGMQIQWIEASSVEEARQHLMLGPIDLALIEAQLPDGSGLALASQMRSRRSSITQTIVMTSQPSYQQAVDAMRSGVGDLLVKPLNQQELHDRVDQAVSRWKSDRRTRRRIKRLRQSCKELNRARDEITQQVDVLCNDLVNAYQELAHQFQNAVQTHEFAGLVRDELDIEQLLHRTLEYFLEKAGPTNAAIFLPAHGDEYSLAGYVNYDCTEEATDMLWQYLADFVIPKVSQRDESVLHIDSDTLEQWVGDPSAYLAQRNVLALNCLHEDDILAVVVMFRDLDQPYHHDLVETCTAIAPVLGTHLSKVVRIHHRHLGTYD